MLNFGTFDLETIGLGGKFVNGGVYCDGEYHYFEKINNLIEFMLSSKISLFYAHNSGKYDTRYIMDYLISNEYEIKPTVINGSIAKLSVYKKKRKVLEIRDSYLILRSSLKKLTKDFDVEHKKIELEQDYEKIKITEQEKEYLYYDVISLYEVLEKFFSIIKDRNLIKPSLTISATALKDYSTNYPNKYKQILNIDTPELREGYFGGRTEIFKTYFKSDTQKLNCYDVNSLYPYVMHEFKFPVGEYYISKEPKEKEYISKINFICPKDLEIPLLPIHQNKKLIFPTGFGSGLYSRYEIEKAIDLGYKIEYVKTYNFKQSDYLFNDYIDYWYSIKKKSKGSLRTISKLMLNSLYGKFGTKPERERYIINPDKKWIDKNYSNWTLNNFDKYEIWSNKFKFNMPYVNLPIVIYITSLSRLTLYKYMEKCKDVYYCDTDSVFTTSELETSLDLGGMKLEKEIKEAYFLRPKVYSLKLVNNSEIIKAKGFKADRIKFNSYKLAFNNNDYKYFNQTTKNIGGFKTTLKRFGKFITPYEMTKRITSQYSKRLILENGIDTKPIYLKKSEKQTI